jgi:lysophospholipase L1-like esterase
MKKYVLHTSLILNGIFIVLFVITAIAFKEEILRKINERRGKAGIVMFGDSIIKKGDWRRLLDRRDIMISGFDGFTTSHLKGLVKKHVVDYEPEICFMAAGINDILVGIPLERTKSNYAAILDTLLSNSITPVLQSTLYQEDNPYSKEKVDSLNAFLRNICEQKFIPFLDINSILSDDKGLSPPYSKDGTHLTPEAYRAWSEEIKTFLSSKYFN